MWRKTITFPWFINLVLWSSAAILWGLCAVFWGDGVNWILVPTAILMTWVAPAFTWFNVVIDSAGVRATSILKFPGIKVFAEDVVSVSAETINPLGDFLGWGLRYRTRKDYGLIMRRGPAIVINTKDGRKITITLPEAETVAHRLRHVVDAQDNPLN